MIRIQRHRTKGWRMPAGAVYVGRPSIWGNPFSELGLPVETTLDLYRNAVRGIWNPQSLIALEVSDEVGADVYQALRQWSDRIGDHPMHMARAHLAGHDLACWCSLDRPCHADVLIELLEATA